MSRRYSARPVPPTPPGKRPPSITIDDEELNSALGSLKSIEAEEESMASVDASFSESAPIPQVQVGSPTNFRKRTASIDGQGGLRQARGSVRKPVSPGNRSPRASLDLSNRMSRGNSPATSPRAGGNVSPRAGGNLSPRAGGNVSPRHRSPRTSARLSTEVGRKPRRSPSPSGRPLPPPPTTKSPATGPPQEKLPSPPSLHKSIKNVTSKEVEKPKKEKDPEKDLKKRRHVVAEIISTEERYVEQLNQIVTCYQKPLLEAEVLKEEDNKTVFNNIQKLIKLHEKLLESLRAQLNGKDSPGDDFNVGEAFSSILPSEGAYEMASVFLSGGSTDLTSYIAYINRFHEGGQRLRKLAKKRKFGKYLDRCQHSNLSGLTGLETLLVVPVQRVPRYVLLLREVIKCTPKTHPDYQPCEQAFREMEKVTAFINEKKREFEKLERLRFISENLEGGNMGALRETSKSLGKPHDFKIQRILIPQKCNWCQENIHLHTYTCTKCGYDAHAQCHKKATNCGEQEDDRKPELIKAYRNIIKEGVLEVKSTNMDKLMEYESKKFEKRDVLLCNDSIAILKVVSGEAAVVAGDLPQEQKFEVVDLVKWTSSQGYENAVLNSNVAEDLFSISNKRQKILHTFRSKDKKDEWVKDITKTMDDWKALCLKHEEREREVTEQLTGFKFEISGTVPVASANEKPFTVYIIQMTNEKGTLTILKRYRQLLALHHRLEEIYGSSALPKFPGKKLIGNTDEKFLQKRARQLSNYLDGIVKLENILKIPEVRSFLMTTVSAKNEDELLPVFQTEEERINLDALIADSEPMSELSEMSEISEASPSLSPRKMKEVERIAEIIDEGEEFVALYDYDGSAEGSLKFSKGEVVQVLTKSEKDDWWYCAKQDGTEGYAPKNYLTNP